MRHIVIADDLTGANNVGVLLARNGPSTLVVTHETPAFPGSCDVLCVDTDSRYVTPAEATRRVQHVVERGLSQGAQLFCKRVDNLLRGNIGAEIAGILDPLGSSALAVVAPAFPILGRQVVDGNLIVNGVPVHEHPVAANDPFAPVRVSSIPDMIVQQFDTRVTLLGLPDVESGVETLAEQLERAAASGSRVAVIDAQSDAHLRTIAQAMALLDRPCVPVDPGPLSGMYLDIRRTHGQPSRGHKVLVSVGSITPLSRQQVARVLSRFGLEPVRLDARALLDSMSVQAEIGVAVRECLRQARLGADVIVLTTHPVDGSPMDLNPMALELGVSTHKLAKAISHGLARATLEILSESEGAIGGCYASGGDLMGSLFQVSRSEAIKILGDVVPLTACVELVGGQLHGLRMVTKGGSIGDEATLEDCVRYLLAELRRV